MKTETKTKICRCGVQFEYTNNQGNIYNPLCEKCEKKELEYRLEEAKKEAKKRIEKITKQLSDVTPSRFSSTDINHKDFNLAAYNKIRTWKPTQERPWLGLVGVSGLCKTRMAYLIANRLLTEWVKRGDDKQIAKLQSTGKHDGFYFQSLPRFTITTAYDLRQQILKSTDYNNKEGKPKVEEFLSQAKHADLLIIDDIGKGRFTPAVAEGFFGLLNYRHEHDLVTIWTANSSPLQLASMLPVEMHQDMGGAFAGRLIDSSIICNLT